ncbi:hypothetical protein QCA50_004768 [Cerrena zonata]|uniref:Uncharacterized protein n=1 Tax=Cerrena zonata TaxID=2478898 RepID=A0AAW0GJJ8_9APHY
MPNMDCLRLFSTTRPFSYATSTAISIMPHSTRPTNIIHTRVKLAEPCLQSQFLGCEPTLYTPGFTSLAQVDTSKRPFVFHHLEYFLLIRLFQLKILGWNFGVSPRFIVTLNDHRSDSNVLRPLTGCT